MSDTTDSIETVKYANLTVANRLHNTIDILKMRNVEKYSNVGDVKLQDEDLQIVCAEIPIIESLQDVTYSAETLNDDDEDVLQIVHRFLSKNIEDIKKDINDTKLLLNEDNEAINRMEDATKRLHNLKIHNNESHQHTDNVIREVTKKFRTFKEYLNNLISTLYPEQEEAIKTILMDLVSVSPDNSDIYPYIEGKEEYDSAALEVLTFASIIQIHPEYGTYFKLDGLF